MMKALRKFAVQNDIPSVDLIAALDQDRHHMLSWVHLSPTANRIIARTLTDELAHKFCPMQAKSHALGQGPE